MPSNEGHRGLTIRKLRESQGKKGIDLSREVGISPAYLSEIERGIKSPSLPILSRIAEALGVKPSDLVGDSLFSLVSIRGENSNRGEVSILRDYVLCPVLTNRDQICGEGSGLIGTEGAGIVERIPVPTNELIGPDAPRHCFLVKAESDSMSPKVRVGDLCMVNPNLP